MAIVQQRPRQPAGERGNLVLSQHVGDSIYIGDASTPGGVIVVSVMRVTSAGKVRLCIEADRATPIVRSNARRRGPRDQAAPSVDQALGDYESHRQALQSPRSILPFPPAEAALDASADSLVDDLDNRDELTSDEADA